MKTRDLSGRALDYAVALAEGLQLCDWYGRGVTRFNGLKLDLGYGRFRPYILDSDITRAQVKACEDSPFLSDQQYWQPTRAVEGDDIIDRERISTEIGHSGQWLAYSMYNLNDDKNFMVIGTTRREAAMRCYVLSKLGDDVEIPKELK